MKTQECDMLIIARPHVSPLRIHRVSFGITPHGTNRSELFDQCREALSTCEGAVELPYLQGDRYRGLFELISGVKRYATVKFDPLIDTNAPIRLAVEPHASGPDGLARLQGIFISLLGMEYEIAMRQAHATDLAVAVDVSNTRLDDLALTDAHVRKSALYFNGDGSAERVQLGSDNSDRFIAVFSSADAEAEGVTIEASTRLRGIRLKDLPTIENPFDGINISALELLDEHDSDSWRMFVDACRKRGALAALARLHDKKRRDRFRQRLGKTLKVGWWDPETVWKEFPATLKSCFNV
jgi:hypothetical protein